MEVQKKKVIRIKSKEEVLMQQKLAPMFCSTKQKTSLEKPLEKPLDSPIKTIPLPMPEEKPVLEQFLQTLDEKELIAYNIAKSHLGLLFSLDRSNCYLEWLEKKT